MLEHILNFWDWEFTNLTGKRDFMLLIGVTITKGIRDSVGRALLMGAAKGWGIVHDKISEHFLLIVISAVLYFIVDVAYEITFRTRLHTSFSLMITLSIGLVLLNTFVFYCIFLWFAQIFERLDTSNQRYKLKLFKRFATILAVGAVICIVWTIAETLGKFFLDFETIWHYSWLYIAVWDVIFLLMVLSLLVVWRIETNSKLLASHHELRNQDDELSAEEEGKYGIELSKY